MVERKGPRMGTKDIIGSILEAGVSKEVGWKG